MSNSMNIDPKCVSIYDDTKCGLFEFTNEEKAIQVGYLGWIKVDSSIIINVDFYEALIKNNTDIEMKWPKCDVIYSSKMTKLAQKVQWLNVPARLLAYGTWVEMCDKSNDLINFDETKLTRSTRRVRHAVDGANNYEPNNTKVNIKEINLKKKLFKKKDILSSASKSSINIMKQINERNCSKSLSKSFKKRKNSMSSFIESDTRDLSDDTSGNDEVQYHKSSKDELNNKIRVLNFENRKLRMQVAQQRAIIEASKSISDINNLSSKILSTLNQSLNIITTKQIYHSVHNDTTIAASHKLVKPIKKSEIKKLSVVSSNLPNINSKSEESVCHQPVVDKINVPTDITNILETYNTLPKLQPSSSQDVDQNSINDYFLELCESAALDKETTQLVNTSQSLIISPENYSSGELMDIAAVATDLPLMSDNNDYNFRENLVELWPKSGVRVHPNKLALVNRKSFTKLVGDLMLIVFTEIELKNGSVTGKKCNFKKSNELPKEKLNENKTMAILDFTLSIFPDTNKIEIEKAMRMKLNNFNKKKLTTAITHHPTTSVSL